MSLPTAKQFQKNLDTHCQIFFTTSHQDCLITEVKVQNSAPNKTAKEQFSVIFSQPNATVHQQGVYTIKHEKMGQFELFLVPVFGDHEVVNYEAIFT